MKLSDEAAFFQADDGSMVVYSGTSLLAPLLVSPDGQTFFTMVRRGFGGTTNEHQVSFEDPHHNVQGDINRKGDLLTLKGKNYTRVVARTEIDVVPLPTVRQPEYLFQLGNGDLLYVSADKHEYSYKSFKLFVGPANNMTEVPIDDVARYSDGGTTYISTSQGTLHSPTAFRSEQPTWIDEQITRLDPSDFSITETDAGVQITGGPAAPEVTTSADSLGRLLAQRADEARKHPELDLREYVRGVTDDGFAVVVDEIYGGRFTGYENRFVVFVEKLADLNDDSYTPRPATVTGARRLRDGGTTTIESSRGRIHVPTPDKKELKPSLDGKSLTPVAVATPQLSTRRGAGLDGIG